MGRDYLDKLAQDAWARVKRGYYALKGYESPNGEAPKRPTKSLKRAIEEALKKGKNPIIAELKYASPSSGHYGNHTPPSLMAKRMMEGGAIGISILTDPDNFEGSLRYILEVRGAVDLPILMKDFVVSREQVDAAARLGANAILLIEALFRRGYPNLEREAMVRYAHDQGLEVLLEAYGAEELMALRDSEADILGLNSRDLRSLAIDEGTARLRPPPLAKPLVYESGIEGPGQILSLRALGYSAFLVGTSIMKAQDTVAFIRSLVDAELGHG